jgi:hypothetical protein
MPWWGWLAVGLAVGAPAGYFTACLMFAASARDGM